MMKNILTYFEGKNDSHRQQILLLREKMDHCRCVSLCKIYMVQYATFQYFYIWVWPNRFYSGFSKELSFDLFVKRKDVVESQMAREWFTWKIMTMGRGYLPELLQFIWTFFKNVSTSDQNYHILKVVSVKTKVVVRN